MTTEQSEKIVAHLGFIAKQLEIANGLKKRELALMELMAEDQFNIKLESELPSPDCTHAVGEDCTVCRECGKCSEGLDDVDRCPECLPVDEDSASDS